MSDQNFTIWDVLALIVGIIYLIWGNWDVEGSGYLVTHKELQEAIAETEEQIYQPK